MDMVGQPDEGEARAEQARRNKRLARGAGLVVLAIAAIAFVAQNAQPVKVRFWFVTAHPKLIYVVVACLLVGGLFGLVLGSPARRRRAARRERRRGH